MNSFEINNEWLITKKTSFNHSIMRDGATLKNQLRLFGIFAIQNLNTDLLWNTISEK